MATTTTGFTAASVPSACNQSACMLHIFSDAHPMRAWFWFAKFAVSWMHLPAFPQFSKKSSLSPFFSGMASLSLHTAAFAGCNQRHLLIHCKICCWLGMDLSAFLTAMVPLTAHHLLRRLGLTAASPHAGQPCLPGAAVSPCPRC